MIDLNNMSVKCKRIIGMFLVLGTILSLLIVVSSWNDMFYDHTTWMYRDGWQFMALIILDFIFLPIAGLVSSISFFRNGKIWRPITKAIIINITLLMTFPLYFCVMMISVDFLYGLLVLTLVSLSLWGLYGLWKCIYRL